MPNKKTFFIFLTVLFLNLSFFVPKVSAGNFGLGASCTYKVYTTGMSCDVFNDTSLNTANLISIVISSNNYDDSGGIQITGPLGTVQTHNAPGYAFANWPNGTDITAWFSFDGVGIYTIRAFAKDSICCDMGGWINFTVTTADPLSISASPSSITSGVAASVQFTVTSNAVAVFGATVTLSGGAAGTCATNASGQCSITITAASNVTATASKTGYTSGSTIVTVLPPSPSCAAGLVPCGRSCDDPSTSDIDESKPCQLCHLFVLLDRIIDFLLINILFPIAVLILVFAGVLYVGAVFEILPGGFQTLRQAKGIILSVILGLIVIFAAFILIGLFLKLIDLAAWTTNIYQNWWSQGFFQINCQIK